jgi:uncharacterized membrane protein YphA (DoxX/SURF4 family)
MLTNAEGARGTNPSNVKRSKAFDPDRPQPVEHNSRLMPTDNACHPKPSDSVALPSGPGLGLRARPWLRQAFSRTALAWAYRLCGVVLASVFIYAGLSKLWAPRAFARLISAYDLVPDPLLAPLAIGLPVIEVLAGAGLLLGIRGSLGTLLGLITLFLGVLGYAIVNHMDVDCGCFSPEEIDARKTLRLAFFRDLGLLALAAYMVAWRWIRKQAGGESNNETRVFSNNVRGGVGR